MTAAVLSNALIGVDEQERGLGPGGDALDLRAGRREKVAIADHVDSGLEFQDPLTEPFAGSISLAAGGTLHPTVIAPCANPTSALYLIAWTGSGTAPGTTLGPGLLLPLNVDALTQIGLGNLNGPIFGSFLGVLNAQGVGQAQFTLPPSLAIPTGPTHFATVLLSSTTLFTAVSNPIQLTLLP